MLYAVHILTVCSIVQGAMRTDPPPQDCFFADSGVNGHRWKLRTKPLGRLGKFASRKELLSRVYATFVLQQSIPILRGVWSGR